MPPLTKYRLYNETEVYTGFKTPQKPEAIDVPSVQCEGVYSGYSGFQGFIVSYKVFIPYYYCWLATVTTRRSATKVTLHIDGVRESSPVDLQLSQRFTTVYRLAPGSLLGPGESETKAGLLDEQYCVSTLVCIMFGDTRRSSKPLE